MGTIPPHLLGCRGSIGEVLLEYGSEDVQQKQKAERGSLRHLIGLGDRHLDNLLLDLITGEAGIFPVQT